MNSNQSSGQLIKMYNETRGLVNKAVSEMK